VPAEGPSAEWFDRSPPRHPPGGGPGAFLRWLLAPDLGSLSRTPPLPDSTSDRSTRSDRLAMMKASATAPWSRGGTNRP